MTNAITAGTDAKRKSLTMAFTKFLSIANPANGKEFLSEVCYAKLIFSWIAFESSSLQHCVCIISPGNEHSILRAKRILV